MAMSTEPAFADPRFEFVQAPGEEFITNGGDDYDVIVVDSPDPVGPALALFSGDFYAACAARLSPGGVMVTQSGVPFLQADELKTGQARLRTHFADVSCFVMPVPTYVGGHMTIGWATDDPALRALDSAAIAARHAAAGGFATRYWSPDVHVAAFALPPYIAEAAAP